MTLYDNMAATAIRQIADKGRNITYRSFSSGDFDPASGSVISESTEDTTIKAVFTNIRIEKIDGTALQRGDKIVLIAADLVTPDEKDRIIDGDDTYQIISIEEIKPGDTPVVYKLQVRK